MRDFRKNLAFSGYLGVLTIEDFIFRKISGFSCEGRIFFEKKVDF